MFFRLLLKRVIGDVSAFLVLVLLFVSSPAEAKQGDGDFFLVPFMGGYSFDGSQGIKTGSIFGLRLGRALTSQWGVEGSIGTVSTKLEFDAKDINATILDLSALYHFKQGKQWNSFVTAGVGGINVGLRGSNPMLNYGAGVHYILLPERVALRAEIKHLFDFDSQKVFGNFAYTVGLTFRAPRIILPIVVPKPKPPDSDQDSIPDARDICPNTPLGEKVEENGCSIDQDKDGVSDILDLCPGTPAGISVDKNGCPLNTDLDNIPDSLDKCPNTLAGISVDKNGCPLDTDLDSIPDSLDRCPNTLTGMSVDNNGCPLDTDSDGVPDTFDICPGTPIGKEARPFGCPRESEEEKGARDADRDGIVDSLDQCKDSPSGALVNSAGCPPPLLKEKAQIDLKIQFDPNQARVKPQYEKQIKAVAEVMISHPGTVVQIQGYTDNTGSDKVSLILSQLRAESVRQYLIDHYGINPSRLTAKGYGSLNPIADNRTRVGREKNNRIVAVIAELY